MLIEVAAETVIESNDIIAIFKDGSLLRGGSLNGKADESRSFILTQSAGKISIINSSKSIELIKLILS